nr:hypothetical protein [uncultured Campylobacter sp.]
MKNEFRQTSQTSYLKVIFKPYLKFRALSAAICSRRTEAKFQAFIAAMRRRFLYCSDNLNFYLAKILKPQGRGGVDRLNLSRRDPLRRCLNLRPIKTITIKASVLYDVMDDAS